jgi:hypothetical protein
MYESDFELWLEFEHWMPQENDGPEDDFINMGIRLSSGVKYALNVWTFKFLERARRGDQQSGDKLNGKYLVAPDLFVEKLDRQLLEDVVADMIHTHNLCKEWIVPDELDDEPDCEDQEPSH